MVYEMKEEEVLFRIAIYDDDEIFATKLEKNIIKYMNGQGEKVDLDIFYHEKELFQAINEEGYYDILFLDIELGETTGIEVGKKIRLNMKKTKIIYVSSKQDYAMALFKNRPFDFLVKPVSYQELQDVMNEYKSIYGFKRHFFEFKKNKKKYLIEESEIMYFQSSGRKIIMHTVDEEITFYDKLSEIEKRLESKQFCVPHKSFIVNMDYVKIFKGNSVQMANGEEIPISQSKREQMNQKIMEYFGKNRDNLCK